MFKKSSYAATSLPYIISSQCFTIIKLRIIATLNYVLATYLFAFYEAMQYKASYIAVQYIANRTLMLRKTQKYSLQSVNDNQYTCHIMYKYTDYYHLRIQERSLLENN